MESTLFLAKVWGPAILLVGIGMFISRGYYMRIYRELEKDSLAVLTFGLVAFAAGVAQVLYHNVWDSFPAGLISFLGWATLVKGALFLVAPRFVDKSGDFAADSKIVPIAGVVMLVAGVYVSWIGYFA